MDPIAGAAGGSILVHAKTFQTIGGYDQEIFYNYSPEDAFFLLKLKAFSKYADNPPITMYHLWHQHVRGVTSAAKLTRWNQLCEWFGTLTNEEKETYQIVRRGWLREFVRTVLKWKKSPELPLIAPAPHHIPFFSPDTLNDTINVLGSGTVTR